ncbi:DMT family transporter [Myxococcota bacterium]|nr:DMT family transporter [Myxococcota bacterium]MBU1533760.1 DMT family transporter [Myxococcota bacterium]
MSVRDFLFLWLLGALWGASFLFMRVAAPQFGPLALLGIRVGLAMVVLFPVLMTSKNRPQLWRHRWDFLFMALFNMVLPFGLLAFASLRIEAGFTALLNSTTPLFAALVGVVWLGKPVGFTKIAGIAAGMAGIVVLFGDRMGFAAGGAGVSVLAALGASLCYGLSSNYHSKKMSRLVPVEATAAALLWAALIMAPITVIFWPAVMPSAVSWASVVALAVVCTAFALILYLGILNRSGVLAATSVTFLIPIFAILWGFVFLAEPLTARLFGGLPLVLLGTALTLDIFKLEKRRATA